MPISINAEYISNQKSSNQIELLQIELFKNKSTHLAEISRAPIQSWVPLALLLIDKESTVSKIKNYVKLIKQVVDSIPALSLSSCASGSQDCFGALLISER